MFLGGRILIGVVEVEQGVEKVRQRRSRSFVVLTYSLVRSARQRTSGLAGRAFLNTLSIQ